MFTVSKFQTPMDYSCLFLNFVLIPLIIPTHSLYSPLQAILDSNPKYFTNFKWISRNSILLQGKHSVMNVGIEGLAHPIRLSIRMSQIHTHIQSGISACKFLIMNQKIKIYGFSPIEPFVTTSNIGGHYDGVVTATDSTPSEPSFLPTTLVWRSVTATATHPMGSLSPPVRQRGS